MTKNFEHEEIDRLMAEAMKKEEMTSEGTVSGRLGGLLPGEISKFNDDISKVVGFQRDEKDYKSIIAFNKKILESGVINHYVYNDKVGVYECVGITFVDGKYLHLNKEISQELVLMSTEYSEI